MNRKYSIITAVLMFLSTHVNFAAQMTNKDLYNLIVSMSRNNSLTQARLDRNNITIDRAVQIVEIQKEILEKERTSLQRSYVPGLLKLIGGSLGLMSFIGGVVAGASAVGSYMIFEQPKMRKVHGPHYLELLKSEYAFEQGFFDRIKKFRIEQLYLKGLSEEQQAIVSVGLKAPLIAGGSLVAWGLYRYLWNKATSYTTEIARLTEEITRDAAILEALKALRSSPEFQ